ncbi:MAG: hypothetical protein JNK42_05245 [Caedimonas sp.]|nr:hypothetical protein [Caedimonas sp.]
MIFQKSYLIVNSMILRIEETIMFFQHGGIHMKSFKKTYSTFVLSGLCFVINCCSITASASDQKNDEEENCQTMTRKSTDLEDITSSLHEGQNKQNEETNVPTTAQEEKIESDDTPPVAPKTKNKKRRCTIL